MGSRLMGDSSSAAGSCHINKAPELCCTQSAPCQPDKALALRSLMMGLLSEAAVQFQSINCVVIRVLFDTVIIEAEGKLFFYTFSRERLILR